MPLQRALCPYIFVLCFLLALTLSQAHKPCGGNTSDPSGPQQYRDFSYSTRIVENEYIVTFHGNYLPDGRQRIIQSAVGKSPIFAQKWTIVEGGNPGARLPSNHAVLRTAIKGKILSGLIGRMEEHRLVKRVTQQKLVTRKPLSVTFENEAGEWKSRDLQFAVPKQITGLLQANVLWQNGFTGAGIRVAVFDTGLRKNHQHFKNVKERSNWTNEKTVDDDIGHGSFVAGVIASTSECLGFAPDADLYIFRVFTSRQMSYTSWFLDAFNYAIYRKIQVLNLSIGGPDFLDFPFVEKVLELTANGVTMVSAIGNQGPLYGTLNNPADQMDVIGVGGIDFQNRLASFSSRGMTTWELPSGYGRVKPDIVAYGMGVLGSRPQGGCNPLSGTSVASPVVAGAVALLASSVVPLEHRNSILNPASMKQALLESAIRVPEANIFEQGSGRLNLLGAHEILRTYHPRISSHPAAADLTQCPYMWPYCTQPLYHTAMPYIVNLTILNGMGVYGEMRDAPIWVPTENGEMIQVEFEYSQRLWPWTGHVAVHVTVPSAGAQFQGTAAGNITIIVVAPPKAGQTEMQLSSVVVPLRVAIIPTPPREKRLLWDQYHNLRYPGGYFPRDDLTRKQDPLDWNGDHPHTNFHHMYNWLRDHGYYLEILGQPITCFDAKMYGTFLLVDTEEEFFPEEVEKLKNDVEVHGLSLLVAAEWYNEEVIQKIRFFDENTHRWWTPETGGANVPALNDLLSGLGLVFGSRVFAGTYSLPGLAKPIAYSSGTSLVKFPAGGLLVRHTLQDQSSEAVRGVSMDVEDVPIMGLYQLPNGGGRIVAYGDSSCLDDTHSANGCFDLLDLMLNFTCGGSMPKSLASVAKPLVEKFVAEPPEVPKRPLTSELHRYSKVVGKDGQPTANHPLPKCKNIFARPLSQTGTDDPIERVHVTMSEGLMLLADDSAVEEGNNFLPVVGQDTKGQATTPGGTVEWWAVQRDHLSGPGQWFENLLARLQVTAILFGAVLLLGGVLWATCSVRKSAAVGASRRLRLWDV